MLLPTVPKVIHFNLTQEQLGDFYNFDTLKFKPGWRDYLSNLLGEDNRYCVLKFGYNHEKKKNSNKKNSSVFKIKANCKLPS